MTPAQICLINDNPIKVDGVNWYELAIGREVLKYISSKPSSLWFQYDLSLELRVTYVDVSEELYIILKLKFQQVS